MMFYDIDCNILLFFLECNRYIDLLREINGSNRVSFCVFLEFDFFDFYKNIRIFLLVDEGKVIEMI